MSCCDPSPDDGEVTALTWTTGNPPTVQTLNVNINACGVQDAGTWYSAYTFDGVTKVLHLSSPTQIAPPLPSAARFRPEDAGSTVVQQVHIQCWGTQDVSAQNFDLKGNTSGVIGIFFTFEASTSGPIGNANGP
jgi:hypothetical protein